MAKKHALLSSAAFSSLAVAFALCTAGSAMAADCAPPKLLNSLPMEKLPGSDAMTITATIEGSPQKLLVATGAIPTQMWNSDAVKLGLPVREGARYLDSGGRYSQDVARVAKFTLGSMNTGGFPIYVTPDPDSARTGSGGVLGTDMMQRYDIDLDFARQTLNYFSPESCKGAGIYWAPAKVTSVAMTAYTGLVFVPVTLDGHTITALLDTGADRTFLNPQIAEKLFGLSAGSQEPGTVSDGGALIKAGLHEFSSLSFGGLNFDHPQIAVPFDILTQNTREFHASKTARDQFYLHETLPDMVIGMDVLKKSHLYISFRDQMVYVSAAGDGTALKPAPIEPSWLTVWRSGYARYPVYPFVDL